MRDERSPRSVNCNFSVCNSMYVNSGCLMAVRTVRIAKGTSGLTIFGGWSAERRTTKPISAVLPNA